MQYIIQLWLKVKMAAIETTRQLCFIVEDVQGPEPYQVSCFYEKEKKMCSKKTSKSASKNTFFPKSKLFLVTCLCFLYSRPSTALTAIRLNAILPLAPFQEIFLATLSQKMCDRMFQVTCMVSCPPMEPRTEI